MAGQQSVQSSVRPATTAATTAWSAPPLAAFLNKLNESVPVEVVLVGLMVGRLVVGVVMGGRLVVGVVMVGRLVVGVVMGGRLGWWAAGSDQRERPPSPAAPGSSAAQDRFCARAAAASRPAPPGPHRRVLLQITVDHGTVTGHHSSQHNSQLQPVVPPLPRDHACHQYPVTRRMRMFSSLPAVLLVLTAARTAGQAAQCSQTESASLTCNVKTLQAGPRVIPQVWQH